MLVSPPLSVWVIIDCVEITTLRQGMWEAVASRKHTLNKVYPFGAGSDEVMLHGSVALQLKNGGSAEIEWAGRAELEKTAADGKYRLKFYQVYLVRTSMLRTRDAMLICDRILELQQLTRNRLIIETHIVQS
jgi:hypothetical protein